MGEPVVRCRTMPVLYIRGNLHDIAWIESSRGLAFLLIVADSGCRYEYLTPRMAMPTVAASGLECDVCHRHIEFLYFRERIEVSCADEIGIFLHRFPYGIGLAEISG